MTVEQFLKEKEKNPNFEYDFSKGSSKKSKEDFLKSKTESVMGSTDPEDLIKEQFDTNPIVWGSTNQSGR